MAWLRTLISRFFGLFGKQRHDDELDDELLFHLEMETEENIRKGMTPAEAKRQARLGLGGVEQVKEEYRERRGLPFLESVVQDVRFALRSFRGDLGFTATVLVTLALGVGVSTAVYAVVNAVLLKPLPYKDPDRLVYLKRASLNDGIESLIWRFRGVSAGDCQEWRDNSDLFESVVCLGPNYGILEHGYSHGDFVDKGFCETIGVQPFLGRCFRPDEFRPYGAGSALPIILQYQFWKAQFGGDPKVIGRTYALGGNGYSATVIGVMPREFVFHTLYNKWFLPLSPLPSNSNLQRLFNRAAIARLKPGLTLEQAQAGAEVFSRRMAESHPETHVGWRYFLSPVAEEATGGFGGPLRLLLAASGLVLLIACLNVAGLVLVRSLGRSSEIAVRAAIGAGRLRLIRQLIAENALLSLGGAALGLAVASILVNYLRLWIPSTFWASEVLRVEDIGVDLSVVGFAVIVGLATGILFGLFPAFRSTSIRLADWISEGARGLGGSRAQAARNWLSVMQLCLTVILAVSACLLMRSFMTLQGQGAGFDPRNIVACPVALGTGAPRDNIERGQIYEKFREALASVPGIEAVTVAGGNRFTGDQSTGSYLREGGEGMATASVIAFRASADDGYFEMLGIPLVKGRVFDQGDRSDTQRVAVVNQTAARQLWPDEEPVGKTLFQERQGRAEGPGMAVIGVVGDVLEDGLAKSPHPIVYQPLSQAGDRGMVLLTLFLKTDRNPGSLYPDIVTRLRSVFPESIPFPAYYERLDRLVRDSTWQLNFSMLLVTGLAGLALLVSAVGVYGVLSYAVRQRTREIGLRLALGAERPQVLKMVLRHGLSIGATGVALGMLGAAGLTRFLGSLLYGVEPLDVPTFAGVAVVLLAAALLASYIPARRAASIDPMAALRHE